MANQAHPTSSLSSTPINVAHRSKVLIRLLGTALFLVLSPLYHFSDLPYFAWFLHRFDPPRTVDPRDSIRLRPTVLWIIRRVNGRKTSGLAQPFAQQSTRPLLQLLTTHPIILRISDARCRLKLEGLCWRAKLVPPIHPREVSNQLPSVVVKAVESVNFSHQTLKGSGSPPQALQADRWIEVIGDICGGVASTDL